VRTSCFSSALLLYLRLSRRGFGESFNLVDITFREAELASTHDSLCLLRIAP
jgi:hypothetical protein